MVALAAILGCRPDEEITRYRAPKQELVEKENPGAKPAATEAAPPAEITDRMFGAMIAHDDQYWFLKLSGPKDAVAAEQQTFRDLVKSVRFSGEGKPEWTLPEGWREEPGSDVRYATLKIPSDAAPLQVTVTVLPKPPGDEKRHVLDNVNRWRGQMKLPPLKLTQLDAETEQVELADGTAVTVDLLGSAAPGAVGRGPFMGGASGGK